MHTNFLCRTLITNYFAETHEVVTVMKCTDSYNVIRYSSPYARSEDPSDLDLSTSTMKHDMRFCSQTYLWKLKMFYSLKGVLFQLYRRKVILFPHPSQIVINAAWHFISFHFISFIMHLYCYVYNLRLVQLYITVYYNV